MSNVCAPETLILLPGGIALLVFTRAEPVFARPTKLDGANGARDWPTLGWEHDGQFRFIGVLDTVSYTDLALSDADNQTWQIGSAITLSPDIRDLARCVRESGGPAPQIARLLRAALINLPEADVHEIILRFLDAAASPNGFVEFAVKPDTGGVFLQGWLDRTIAEEGILLTASGQMPAICANFNREDVVSPATGICIFANKNTANISRGESIYLWCGDDLRRLEVVPDLPDPLDGAAATAHVADMLPRLVATQETMDKFNRICRPRYASEDTVSSFEGPVAVGLDLVLQASGGLFLTGWILDPLSQIKLVLVKSTANLYVKVLASAHRLKRPDIFEAFGSDPRFGGLIDPRETRYGFLSYIPAPFEQIEGDDLYLELVLHNGQCLFMPIQPRQCHTIGSAHAVLNTIPQHDPAVKSILLDHVAPFLAGLAPIADDARNRLIPIGTQRPSAHPLVSAIMTVRNPDHLKPIFATLSDTPDADNLELILVMEDSLAPGVVSDLHDQFCFYGLRGGLMLCPDHLSQAAKLDIAASATHAPQILLWHPQALPQKPGWLDVLLNEAANLPKKGLVSPLMCYEDGSIHFGGGRIAGHADASISQLAGFNRKTQQVDGTEEVSAGAAELALIDRQALDVAGGLVGLQIGDSFTHHSLAARLRNQGGAAWFAPNVEFWMLPDTAASREPAFIDLVDAALIGHLAAKEAQPQRERLA